MKQRMLILGGSGRLGRELEAYFAEEWQVDAPPHEALDITNARAIDAYLAKHQPSVVLLAAAQSNVTWCQSHAAEANRLNSYAAEVVAEACLNYGAYLVYYSTDYVFDGQKTTPYTEADRTNPLTEYGKSKLGGERAVMESGARGAILRVSRLYGEFGDSVVTRLIRDALRQQAEKAAGRKPEPIRAVADLVAAPTWTRAVARQTERLVQERGEGIYHCSSEAALSLYQVARQVLALAGLEAEIAPCSSMDYFGEDIRPHYSVLGNERLRQEDRLVMPTHEEAIAQCVQRILKTTPS